MLVGDEFRHVGNWPRLPRRRLTGAGRQEVRKGQNSTVGKDDQARSKVQFQVEVGFEPRYQRLALLEVSGDLRRPAVRDRLGRNYFSQRTYIPWPRPWASRLDLFK